MKGILQIYFEKTIVVWGLIGVASLIALGISFPTLEKSLQLLAFLLAVVIVFYKPWALLQWKKFKDRFLRKGIKAYAPKEFLEHIKEDKFKGKFILGNGFDWGQDKLQAVHDIKSQNEKGLRFLFQEEKAARQGTPWIHALGKEKEISIPEKDLFQHTLFSGSSGSGKTTALISIIGQAIAKGWCVFILDPKGDEALFTKTQKFCELCSRDFKFFHSAHLEKSNAINLMASYGHVSELASRISQALPGEKGNDPFREMCSSALRAVLGGLEILGERPTIKSIYDNLMQRIPFANRVMTTWLVRNKKFEENSCPKGRTAIETFNTLSELCEGYQDKPSELTAVIDLAKKTDERLDKTISSLKDLLSFLTNSDLNDLLSPSSFNENDFVNTRKLIERNSVFYIGNNTLNNPSFGRFLAILFLADLAAAAGDIYNFQKINNRKVLVVIDEASDACCDALLSLLRKARGANIGLVLATQSLEDFTSQLGSESERESLLSNIMTRFSMQIRDEKSCTWLSKQTPTTSLVTKSRTRAVSTNSKKLLLEGMTLGERETLIPDVSLVPPSLFTQLPRGEAFVTCQGGRIIKIRVIYVKEED